MCPASSVAIMLWPNGALKDPLGDLVGSALCRYPFSSRPAAQWSICLPNLSPVSGTKIWIRKPTHKGYSIIIHLFYLFLTPDCTWFSTLRNPYLAPPDWLGIWPFLQELNWQNSTSILVQSIMVLLRHDDSEALWTNRSIKSQEFDWTIPTPRNTFIYLSTLSVQSFWFLTPSTHVSL